MHLALQSVHWSAVAIQSIRSSSLFQTIGLQYKKNVGEWAWWSCGSSWSRYRDDHPLLVGSISISTPFEYGIAACVAHNEENFSNFCWAIGEPQGKLPVSWTLTLCSGRYPRLEFNSHHYCTSTKVQSTQCFTAFKFLEYFASTFCNDLSTSNKGQIWVTVGATYCWNKRSFLLTTNGLICRLLLVMTSRCFNLFFRRLS